MVDMRTDDEQLEMLKKFCKRYGWSIVLGIVLALGLSYGWRYWHRHAQEMSQQASIRYEQMLTAFADDNLTEFQGLANELEHQFRRTPYAQMAGLLQAKVAVENDKLTDALSKLEWVIEQDQMDVLTQIARLRAARVLLALKKPQAALKTLQTVDDQAYMPAINYVRGDIYASLNKNDKARQSYAEASKNMPKTAALAPIVQMKLEALAPS